MGTLSKRTLAVVTGASSGIGLELARQCVEHGYDVIVCAEDEAIERVGLGLGAGTQVVIESIRADLSTYDGVEQLAEAVARAGRPVDALLLNAGVGVSGRFLETNLADELRMIQLSCSSIIHLAKRLLPAMVARGEGKVLVTASVASTAPAPYLTVYGATKAFAYSFAEAIRVELADSGVTVTALQPGATDTDFFHRAHMEDTKVGQGEKDDPADVAKQGFQAMLAGKASVVAASAKSKLIGVANELLPETVKAKQQAKMNEPGSGRKS
jgi:uncharacterized protein